MTQDQKTKTPLLITIVAILQLLSGTLWTALWIATIFIFGPAFAIANWLTLAGALVLIISSIGLRSMRRWALYSYTVLATSYVINSTATIIKAHDGGSAVQLSNYGGVAIAVLVALYLWLNRSAFR